MLEEHCVNKPPPDLWAVEQERLEGLVPVPRWPSGRVEGGGRRVEGGGWREEVEGGG